MTIRKLAGMAVLLCAAAPGGAGADVIASGTDHYTLQHEAASPLSPDALWARLIEPASWWSGEHTYSGDAAALSLKAEAGGLWREDWDGGSVEHGRVLAARPGEMLRLDAPFGPLQGMGVTVVWTIEIRPDDRGGSVVKFTETASGTSASRLDQVAPAVDAVKAEAMRRLVKSPATKR